MDLVPIKIFIQEFMSLRLCSTACASGFWINVAWISLQLIGIKLKCFSWFRLVWSGMSANILNRGLMLRHSQLPPIIWLSWKIPISIESIFLSFVRFGRWMVIYQSSWPPQRESTWLRVSPHFISCCKWKSMWISAFPMPFGARYYDDDDTFFILCFPFNIVIVIILFYMA